MEYKSNEFKNLKVWQKAMEFAVNIYSVTRKFPNEEKFGLAAQINKAAVSIPSNIAEGAGRGSKKEFAQFLSVAYGSSYEIETQLILANKIGFISSEDFQECSTRCAEIQKMIFGLRKSLE